MFSRSPSDAVPAPTAFRPPLYPLVLTATAWQGRVTPWSVAVLHVVLGSLTVVGVRLLGQQWGLGRWSWLAAGLVAADPILLHQAGEVMTETFATFLCVLGMLALTQWSLRATYLRAAMAGAALGLTILCRPTFLIWAALCGLFMMATSRNWKGVVQAMAFGAAVVAILLPWGLRNYWAFGRPIVTTTHGGYTLLLANNPYFYEHLAHRAVGQCVGRSRLGTQDAARHCDAVVARTLGSRVGSQPVRIGAAVDSRTASNVSGRESGAGGESLDSPRASFGCERAGVGPLVTLDDRGLVCRSVRLGGRRRGASGMARGAGFRGSGWAPGVGPDAGPHGVLDQHADASAVDADRGFGRSGCLLPHSTAGQVAVSCFLIISCSYRLAAKLALCQSREASIIPPLDFQSARLVLLAAPGSQHGCRAAGDVTGKDAVPWTLLASETFRSLNHLLHRTKPLGAIGRFASRGSWSACLRLRTRRAPISRCRYPMSGRPLRSMASRRNTGNKVRSKRGSSSGVSSNRTP